MTKSKTILCWFFIGVLTGLLFCSQGREDEPTVIEKHSVDTIFINRIDTIREVKPVYITERVVDTVFIETETSIPVRLPITQRYFAKQGLYDLWVSGYEPNVDSINVYNKVEYRDIYHEVEKQIYPKRTELYGGVGFKLINGTVAPAATISLKTKKEWLIQAEFGLYDQKVMYGASVSRKIF